MTDPRCKTGFKRFLLVLALQAAVLAPALAADDPVVAERGSDHITLGQARSIIAGTDPETRKKLSSPQAISEFLRNILLQRAVMKEALAAKWDKRPEVAAMAQHAHDVAIGQSFLVAQAAVPAGYPSDSEIQAAYDQNKARFMQPRGYHLAQVFLAAQAGAASDAAKAKLASFKTQTASNPAGIEAAAKHLDGAKYIDLGWLGDTQLTPAIKGTVDGLQEGAVSDPVCTASGCHLIRLIATRPAGPAPLPEVKDALVRALRQQKEAEGERAYANTLMSKQAVQVNEIQLSHLAAP